jgi:uncharacterized protein (TIGR03437 family)
VRLIAAALLLAALPLRSQIPPIIAVSAATYQTTLAPDSVGSVFGVNLTNDTATTDVRVDVAGQPASLLYVSPTQINFVVPGGVAPGATTVTVRSGGALIGRTAAVNIVTTAPGLFSADGTGRGAGVILNAVTLAPAPFVTVTVVDGVSTTTRLVAFGTGFRHATQVFAQATTVRGDQFNLTVERVGEGPGGLGTDQVVFLVPAALDGAGTVSLTIATSDSASNTVTFEMGLLPVELLQLNGLTLSPAAVIGGDIMTATITLNGVARAGGFPVSLSSTSLAAQPPQVVRVLEGRSSLNVPVRTLPVSVVQPGVMSTQAKDVTLNAAFEVDPPQIAQLGSISVVPVSTLGGRTLEGTVTLSAAAPAAGVIVQVASDDIGVRPPAFVIIPFNQTSVKFPITTTKVDQPHLVTLVASLNRATVSTTVTLLPLVFLSLDATNVTGGASVNATITLADPAPPGGATVALVTNDIAATGLPPFITVPVGQTSTVVAFQTAIVTLPRIARISAILLGVTSSVDLTIIPLPPLALSGLVVSPDQIPGGQSTSGTVTLTAPAGNAGFVVTLQSSSLLAARVPGFVVVPKGQATLSFPIDTTKAPVSQTVVITASANGVIRSATLIVQ